MIPINQVKMNQYYRGVYRGGNSKTSSRSSNGMRTPLSSCIKNLAFASLGDGDSDRCVESSVADCGTSVLVLSKLVCDPLRGRDDEREVNAVDGKCGRSGAKGWILPIADVLGGSEG